MVRSLNRAAAATSQSPQRRVSLAMHKGRTVHRPTFRVLLVDDSKPFRIKLIRMLQLLFENDCVVVECSTPQEGVKKVMHASKQQPIHIAIVDHIFVGTEQTGLQMCNCLGRKRSEWTNRLPCILISDYAHLHPRPAAGNIVERCHKTNISKQVLLKWCTEYARLNSR